MKLMPDNCVTTIMLRPLEIVDEITLACGGLGELSRTWRDGCGAELAWFRSSIGVIPSEFDGWTSTSPSVGNILYETVVFRVII